jgi:hypothetical protein
MFLAFLISPVSETSPRVVVAPSEYHAEQHEHRQRVHTVVCKQRRQHNVPTERDKQNGFPDKKQLTLV